MIATVADGTVDDALAAVDAARRRGRRLGRDRAAGAGRDPAPGVRADDRPRRRAGQADLAGERQGARRRPRRGRLRGRVLPLVRRGGGPRLGGRSRPRRPGRTGSSCVHQPVGICVLVTPWNFPAAMATRKIGPALAAGCTVHPQAGQRHPADRAGDGGDPGRGRRARGRGQRAAVAAAPARSCRRCCTTRGCASCRSPARPRSAGCCWPRPPTRSSTRSMELGGNAPFLVFADADLDAALDGAMIAKMRNGGEACTAANRFYVEAAGRRRSSPGGWPSGWRRCVSGPAPTRRPRSARWSTRTPVAKVDELVHGARSPAARPRSPAAPGRTGRAATTRRPC